MPPNPAKARADAVQGTLNTYTQHCNDLTNNPPASADQIRAMRRRFMDQFGIDVGMPFDSRGDTKISTWELGLIQRKHGLSKEQCEAVRELNDRFKDLAKLLAKLRGEQNVAQTVKTYTAWLDDNAQASAEQIGATETQLLNQLSADISSEPQSRSHLLSMKQGVGLHAPAQLEAALALHKRFKTASERARRTPEQFQGSIQAAVPPPPQRREEVPRPPQRQEEDFAAMVRRMAGEPSPVPPAAPHATAAGQPNRPSTAQHQWPPPPQKSRYFPSQQGTPAQQQLQSLRPPSSITSSFGAQIPYAYGARTAAGQPNQTFPTQSSHHPPTSDSHRSSELWSAASQAAAEAHLTAFRTTGPYKPPYDVQHTALQPFGNDRPSGAFVPSDVVRQSSQASELPQRPTATPPTPNTQYANELLGIDTLASRQWSDLQRRGPGGNSPQSPGYGTSR
jgi:hypothetical protein